MNSEAEITRLAKENETFQKSSRHSNIRSIFSLIILFPVRKKRARKELSYHLNFSGIKRAADGNRTRDLRTTNATLYRLSHSSIMFSQHLYYYTIGSSDCQA